VFGRKKIKSQTFDELKKIMTHYASSKVHTCLKDSAVVLNEVFNIQQSHDIFHSELLAGGL